MDETLTAQKARVLAEQMIHSYFTTQEIPLTKHHIDSFDQFLDRDMINIIKANNPILILKDQIPNTDQYRYRVEIFVGGLDGTQLFLGSPTLKLENGKILKLLYPNEARLRNATYALQVEANLIVRVSIKPSAKDDPIIQDVTFERFNLFQLPLMLKSRYCVLHAKPKEFLREAGECPNDGGGYFIVDGSEKVLITRQEAAFNTLYISEQQNDLKVSHYATMSSLNPKTRVVKRVAFYWTRERTKKGVFGKPPQYLPSVMEVSIPFVRKPVNIFVLFRALGVQSDEDILRLMYPDLDAPEAQAAAELLIPSMAHAFPFTDTYSAIQYIKTLTKGFSEFHVLDVIHNNLFPHVEDLPGTRAAFLASCVRKILRVVMGVDSSTSRDDTRNQRLLTSGFLVQMLFQGVFKQWTSAVKRRIDEEYNYNKALYSGDKFMNIFSPGNVRTMFRAGFITEGLMRGFKGKWQVGGSKVGEEKSGVLQALSRLSYLDFMSHCRRVVLDFDTGMKLAGPRRLNTTQYGYFCTSETPSGGSIGITKNLSMFTSISTGADTDALVKWLFSKGQVLSCADCTPQLQAIMVPIYLNNGLLGYTAKPKELTSVLRLFKRTACLPPYSSVGFNIPQRQVFIFTEEGRPLRPLWIVPLKTNRISKDWRLNVIGSLPSRQTAALTSTLFIDPLAEKADATFQEYTTLLTPHQGSIEYVDPYEQNEILIANLPEHIVKETTHMEIHPSTILGLLGNMIPFPNHNQSPRNQLSASQSKQSLSMYATNWKNRFDNTANVMCYGEAPLVRTLYQDYIGAGEMPYGHNIVLAMGIYTGYNQEDGIVMNADSLARGLFRNITYRSYEAFEEDDERAKTRTRIGNPEQVHAWMDLNVALDYSKLDESGLVRVGEYVDETTVIVGRYMMMDTGKIKDASVTPQVWTRGRVESVVVTVNNAGLRLVKIRVVQDRSPELGDKFCLTDDHEVLTKNRGWVQISEVTLDDKVAQLNREKDQIEYVHPKETFVFDHTGEMYEVSAQGVSLCTTLNHRMWVQPRNSEKHSLIEAKDMMGKRVRFSAYSPTHDDDYYLTIGSKTYTKDEMIYFLSLFGIWIAEGWTYINNKDYISRVEFSAQKPRVQQVLEHSCENLGLNHSFNEKSGKFYINSKELANYLEPFSIGAINKRLPSWCFELSQEQSRILLQAICCGDGHETKTSLHVGTSSIDLRDDIQILAQHSGFTSTYAKLMSKGDVNIARDGTQFKANADHWGISIRRKRLYPTLNHGHAHSQGGQSEKILQFDGKVYCISVPSEVFLVRRNGNILWTGNSNRHGQKGTLGMAFRGHDMPRTEDGIVPDMIMNPHAIPSRMTIGQLLEQLFGKAAAEVGAIANSTAWMNEGSPHEQIGAVLEKLGLEKTGNQILYNGQTGEMIEADIFIGNVYGMRLKHMTEDKWNARGEGRREQRTHQPTGGRGNQGGLKIGEMERDAIIGHGVTTFIQESMMKRSDGTSFWVCNGCGTIPIYNEKQRFFICSLCDGPIQYIGDSPSTLEPVPPPTRSGTTFSKIEMPYATKLFMQELEFFMNISMRSLTTKEPTKLPGLDVIQGQVVQDTEGLGLPLPTRTFVDLAVPEVLEVPKTVTVEEALDALQEVSQKAEDLIKLKPLPVVEAPPPTQEEAPPGAILEGDQPQAELPQVQLQPPDQFAKPVQPEQIFTGGAGEGTLIIVDTSEEALKAGGLLEEEKRRPGRPLGGSLEAQQRMSRSPPRRRVSFADQPEGEDEKEYATYKTKLTVQKLE